ncbi:MAG: hypothetical protein GKS06_11390 [Acidobacteria bacterium]|nr:hypothetical protein [Acidobacteriota bacterium]
MAETRIADRNDDYTTVADRANRVGCDCCCTDAVARVLCCWMQTDEGSQGNRDNTAEFASQLMAALGCDPQAVSKSRRADDCDID